MRNVFKVVWPAAILVLASGCAQLNRAPPVAQDEASVAALHEAQRTLDHLTLLEDLARGDPAQQSDIVEQVRHAADASPTFNNQLRYALVLALPGHAASDPVAARTALDALLATPEGLLPAETALASVILQEVDSRLVLLSKNENLSVARREESERAQALNRRLQNQAAENARLKQELDEALAKLEAVADLERSLVERQTVPKGPQP